MNYFKKTQPIFKNMIKLFPLKLIPKKEVKKQRKHWSEFNEEISNLLEGINAAGVKEEKK